MGVPVLRNRRWGPQAQSQDAWNRHRVSDRNCCSKGRRGASFETQFRSSLDCCSSIRSSDRPVCGGRISRTSFDSGCLIDQMWRDHIRPKWKDYPFGQRSKQRLWSNGSSSWLWPRRLEPIFGVLRIQCLRRHNDGNWFDLGKNSISLVRVKGGSKRASRPQILTSDEQFHMKFSNSSPR